MSITLRNSSEAARSRYPCCDAAYASCSDVKRLMTPRQGNVWATDYGKSEPQMTQITRIRTHALTSAFVSRPLTRPVRKIDTRGHEPLRVTLRERLISVRVDLPQQGEARLPNAHAICVICVICGPDVIRGGPDILR